MRWRFPEIYELTDIVQEAEMFRCLERLPILEQEFVRKLPQLWKAIVDIFYAFLGEEMRNLEAF